MTDATFHSMFERLFQATKSKTDSALAEALQITAQSVSQAKKKKLIPAQWFIDISQKYGVSVDWLISGAGSMRLGEQVPAHMQSTQRQPTAGQEQGLFADLMACKTTVERLEKELQSAVAMIRVQEELIRSQKENIKLLAEQNDYYKRGTKNIDAPPSASIAPICTQTNK